MAQTEDRFIKTFSQGVMNVTEIWVDKATGVNYLFHASGYAGGLTPLLKPDGTPVVTPIRNYPE
ncbi:MAG: xylan 1,4-beta-xylosidase [Oscillospiraceae bacterium]|nr:xylan 1,4-beta-xylosidase [Oscillospiraceae bacterium]MBQ8835771.1 xylan 1,4-beta-xylosidase [Oscillospiraceae bacterium]